MGGADEAIVGGTHAVQVNPAGLAQASVPMAQMGLGLVSPAGTFDLNNVVLYPLQDGTVFALSQFSGFYSGYSDTSIVGSAALPLDTARNLTFGLNLKYLLLSNPANSTEGAGRGFGLDMGFMYNLRDAQGVLASFGLTIKDLSSAIRFSNTGEDSVTRTFVLGAAYDAIADTRVELDADFVDQTLGPTNLRDEFNLGAERFFQDRNFSARVGYQNMFQPEGVFTLGGGYHPAQPFEITYALGLSADLKQVSNFLTFVYRLDDWNKNHTEKTDTGGEITLGNAPPSEPEATPTPATHEARPVSGPASRKMTVAVSLPALSAGGGQTTSITFPGAHPDDITAWELLIKGVDGKIYRKIDGTGKPFSAIDWDGTDDQGKGLPSGMYQVALRTFNAAGGLLSDDSTLVQIVGARTHFGLSVNVPYLSLARGKAHAPLVFTPDPGGSFDAQSWDFQVRDAQTRQVVYERKGRLRIPPQIKWNGRTAQAVPAADGPYECLLSAVDKLGNSLQADPVAVTLRSAPPVLSLDAEDHWVDFSKNPKFKFKLSAEDSLGLEGWSVKLLDYDGNVLKTFLGQAGAPAQVVWDGKTDAADMVAGGTFVRAQFTAQDPAGNSAKSDEFPVQVEAPAPTGQSLSLNLTTVYFKDGDDGLTPEAKKELQKAAVSIKPYLDKSLFFLKGYTASAEAGDQLTLSYDRADSVREYLLKVLAVPADKVVALGYADREALKDANGDEPADKQRRVTITLYTQP
ncbi:MAG TPA: OmpA family protein [bacterium]|nr:OmpA family protein [bacterium]